MGANASKPKLSKRKPMCEPMFDTLVDGENQFIFEDRRINFGGSCYFVQIDPAKALKAPPRLSRHHQHSRHSSENVKELALGLEDKLFFADILREENLRAKGKTAREFIEKQAKVIQRKNQIFEEKIQKVQDKMFMEEVRLLNRPRMPRRILSKNRLHKTKSAEVDQMSRYSGTD